MRTMERQEIVSTPLDRWEHWPVDWGAVWVGALTMLAVGLLFGLAGMALGAHQVGENARIVRWTDFGFWPLVFSVLGAFAAFVAGGWVAGKIAGAWRAEPAILHGAIAWLVAVPLLLIACALGAGGFFGSWFGGLAGTPFWAPQPANIPADAALAARNGALGALAALLLGLIGAVIGGWMASGEPMTFTHWRTRDMGKRPDHHPDSMPAR